jgi:hypothetical protein
MNCFHITVFFGVPFTVFQGKLDFLRQILQKYSNVKTAEKPKTFSEQWIVFVGIFGYLFLKNHFQGCI